MREHPKVLDIVITCIGVIFVIFNLTDTAQIFMTIGFVLMPIQARAISLGFVLVLIFLITSTKTKGAGNLPWYDFLLIMMSIAATVYIVIVGPVVAEGRAYATDWDCLFGILLFIALIEGMRRTGGTTVIVIGAVFLFYSYFTNYFPGMLWGPGWGLRRLVSFFYVGIDGIYGEAMSVFTSILIPFLAFGAFLSATGVSRFFMDLAHSLAGWSRGGSAKACIFGSGLMGMMSGSAMANVATVGTLTIPMMKESGYRPETAAAIEAVASTGGQIMPPVMGAAAFLMADYLGVPYIQVAIAAALPAIFYYLFLFVKIDIEAKKLQLKGIPREQLPSFVKVMKKDWYYLIPIVGLVITLAVFSWRAEMCALIAMSLSFFISLRKKDTILTPKRIIRTIDSAARSSIGIGALCAGIGIIIGTTSLTGLGINLSNMLVDLSGGNVTVLLILTAIVAIILGMGMPTAGVYFFCALMLAPALISLGITPMAAHMFILYFGLAALITPPVALAAYTAAPIAGSDPLKTGWIAALMALPLYILPFVFVNHPGLLFIGNIKDVIVAVTIAAGLLMAWFYGIEGYSCLRKIEWQWRLPSLLGIILIVYPNFVLTLIGTGMILLIFFLDVLLKIKSKWDRYS